MLTFGGNDESGAPVLAVAQYTQASGWKKINQLPSRRGYHANGILMPDGTVLIGGGE